MKKSIIRAIEIAFICIFCLGMGLTGAWFTSERTATGTIQMANGISITYENLVGSNPYYLTITGGTNGVISNKLPGDVIGFTSPSVKLASGSADAYFRFKVTYEYSTDGGSNWTTSADPATLGVTALLTVNSGFRKDTTGDNAGWYYLTSAAADAASFTYSQMTILTTTSKALFSSPSLTLVSTTETRKDVRVSVQMQAIQANSAGFTGMAW